MGMGTPAQTTSGSGSSQPCGVGAPMQLCMGTSSVQWGLPLRLAGSSRQRQWKLPYKAGASRVLDGNSHRKTSPVVVDKVSPEYRECLISTPQGAENRGYGAQKSPKESPAGADKARCPPGCSKQGLQEPKIANKIRPGGANAHPAEIGDGALNAVNCGDHSMNLMSSTGGFYVGLVGDFRGRLSISNWVLDNIGGIGWVVGGHFRGATAREWFLRTACQALHELARALRTNCVMADYGGFIAEIRTIRRHGEQARHTDKRAREKTCNDGLLPPPAWYWHIEPDVHLHFDLFLYMQDHGRVYGFTITMYDFDKTIPKRPWQGLHQAPPQAHRPRLHERRRRRRVIARFRCDPPHATHALTLTKRQACCPSAALTGGSDVMSSVTGRLKALARKDYMVTICGPDEEVISVEHL
ncbi:hypothetical protein B0H17DRAFT_1146175 [Mycena rosella]|uniref:Uncharacterized protein n=1 Tax=Mycena rosella TaxID=1033263 RepID=A0AAD7G116_MYCRO|nr:hypothetical protein B0H17DRAFT_1146175 [Mycena rosella]